MGYQVFDAPKNMFLWSFLGIDFGHFGLKSIINIRPAKKGLHKAFRIDLN